MIACPSCQRSVEITEQHYGTLFTCPHCNAVYFIDWAGQPEVASHEAAEPEFTPEATPEASYSEASSSENFENNNFQNDYSAPVENSTFEAGAYEQPVEQNYQAEEAPAFEVPAQDAYTENEPTDQETPYDFGQTLDQSQTVVKPSIADTSDFSDVTDFANANTVTGPLAYTVIIEGIESNQLVNLLKEAMTDSRFAWDVTGHLLRIGGGKLVIEGINPAKASVLVERLKYLPLKISWRQDVLS